MAYAQGSVVLAPASFKGGRRPYLVVSNASRPYFGQEYTVAVITTKERDEATELPSERLAGGRLTYDPSFVNPWSLHVFQHADIYRRVAHVDDELIDEVANEIHRFVERC
jgi:mRNA-degrading endonuclease toxin of MazEF toxin-antitoxin module